MRRFGRSRLASEPQSAGRRVADRALSPGGKEICRAPEPNDPLLQTNTPAHFT